MTIVFTDPLDATTSANIDNYPAGAPDYAYTTGTGGELRVSATNDRLQCNVAGVGKVARIIRPGIPAGDQQITATAFSATSTNDYGSVYVRLDSGGTANGYVLTAKTLNANEVWLERVHNGVFTLLASVDRGLTGGSHTLRLKATGTGASVVLEAQIDGTAVLTYNDTSASRKTSGVPGIGIYNATADTAWVDNVSVDDLIVAGGPATYYVATTGSDSNSGAIGTPFLTLQKAHDVAVPGDFIYVRGGTFTPTVQQTFTRNGAAGNLISLLAYSGETPIFDNVGMSSGWIIRLTSADYWHIKGLELKGAPSCVGGGIWVEDSNDVKIELNNVHHCGLTGILVTGICSNVSVLNNDGHHNRDDVAIGGGYSDADGIRFASLADNSGNVILGNRLWLNANNGLDLAESVGVLVESNWAWHNGFDDTLNSLGEGAGFNLSGTGSARSTGSHIVRNNLAWRNRTIGFSDGLYADDLYLAMTLYNNTAYDNNTENYHLIHQNTVTNNLAYDGPLGTIFGTNPTNSWTLDSDLTQLGTIIARVTAPLGGGNSNLAVIRDGDKPPVNTADSSRQYDTWDGDNTAVDDWIGYTYPASYTFNSVVFQEGGHFSNGGWFTTLTVQVRQSGVWNAVSGLTITPAYPGVNNVTTYETYTLEFNAIQGDGIRIFGDPGGSSDFISVAELDVFEPTALTISDADFVSLDFSGASSARQSDGSLPVLNFLKLVSGSDLIDAGTSVGLPFLGNGPDLGAYEFVEAPPSAPDPGMPLLPGIFNPYPALLNF